jgi:hypothetical protein
MGSMPFIYIYILGFYSTSFWKNYMELFYFIICRKLQNRNSLTCSDKSRTFIADYSALLPHLMISRPIPVGLCNIHNSRHGTFFKSDSYVHNFRIA